MWSGPAMSTGQNALMARQTAESAAVYPGQGLGAGLGPGLGPGPGPGLGPGLGPGSSGSFPG